LALVFSTEVYLKIIELKHPHVALTDVLAQLAKETSASERHEIFERVRLLEENFKAVQTAFEKAD
jgi:hypothetical protein